MSLERLAWASWVKGGWINQGEKEALINLPTDKVYCHVPRLADTTEADLISRGFPYFFDVAGGSTDPKHRSVFFQAEPIRAWAFAHLNGKVGLQWTQQEVTDFVMNSFGAFGVMSHSLDEAVPGSIYENYTFPTGSAQADWANEALLTVANSVTPHSVLMTSYAAKYLGGQDVFLNGSTPINPNTPAARNALASQANARAGIPFYSQAASSGARANVNIYPGTGLRNVNGNWSNYILIYEFLRLRLASGPALPPLGFTWCSLEQGGYTGSYGWRHELPTGTLYQNDEIFWSWNKCFHVTMTCFLFGGGQLLWNRPDRFLADSGKLNVRVDHNDPSLAGLPADVWVGKNGAPAPTQSTPRYYPMRSEAVNDAHLSSVVDYGKMASAAGTNHQFARYRVNKGTGYGAWNEVASDIPDASILEAAQNFRGICAISGTGNDSSLYYQNPANTIKGERVQVDLGNNRFVDFDVYGQEPVRIRGSINANATQTLNR